MRRVLVLGQSASGKSTVARALAGHLGSPHIELDALFHGPGWTVREAFVEDVALLTAGPDWIVDGNYVAVRDLLWERADTIVWLDLPRTVTGRRAVVRTAHRLLSRVELWNGNRERVSNVWRGTHPIRWTWDTHAEHRAVYEQRLADPRWSALQVIRLRTTGEVRQWLAGMA